MDTTEPHEAQPTTISNNRYESLNRVTTLSKYLALTLFVALPFIGGYVGYQLSASTHVSMLYESPSNVVVPVEISTPTTAVSSDAYTSWSLQQSFQIPLSGDTSLIGTLQFGAMGSVGEAMIDAPLSAIKVDAAARTIHADEGGIPLLTVHEYSGSTTMRDFIATLILPIMTMSESCTMETVTTKEGNIYYSFVGTLEDNACPERMQFVQLNNYVAVIWYTPVDPESARIDATSLRLTSPTLLQ